jgi:beta-galactosidase
MDPCRLPKTSFYLFKSQNDPDLRIPGAETGPMVYIANYLTPFSPEDITVFSNCEKVRLTLPDGQVLEQTPRGAMPHPPVVFKGVFDWVKDTKKWASPTEALPNDGKITAEGIIGGKVVTKDVRQPASRVSGLELEADYSGAGLTAGGGDFIIVRAYFADAYGNRRVMAKNQIYFTVEGEGELISDERILSNPFQAQFGAAAAFVRASGKAGRIKVTASTTNMGSQSIIIESLEPDIPLLNGALSTRMKTQSHSQQFNQAEAKSGMSESELVSQWAVTPLTCPAN